MSNAAVTIDICGGCQRYAPLYAGQCDRCERGLPPPLPQLLSPHPPATWRLRPVPAPTQPLLRRPAAPIAALPVSVPLLEEPQSVAALEESSMSDVPAPEPPAPSARLAATRGSLFRRLHGDGERP